MSGVGPIQVGIADPNGTATPIFADPGLAPFTALPKRVTLTKDWKQSLPPGWPADPGQTGVHAAGHAYPRAIPSGTVITTFACIANALVAANAATLA